MFGLCIYGLFGHKEAMHKIIRKFEDVDAQLIPLNVQDETILQQLEQEDPLLANQCHYIWKYGNYPVYDTTAVKFYPEMLIWDTRNSLRSWRRQSTLYSDIMP